MKRLRLQTEIRTKLAMLPFYVTHAPWLVERRRNTLAGLKKAGALDVTFVNCANGDEVAAMGPEERGCLNPFTETTRWNDPVKIPMKNGTTSLVLKHMLAMHDMLMRRLPAAVICEDDVEFSDTFDTDTLFFLSHVPTDAALFYLGMPLQYSALFTWVRSQDPRVPPLPSSTRVAGSLGTFYQ